ncbi:MAG: hypothetical protein B7Z08_05210 [Sphingomonadales bacterium 32-68-7]|nr:MAG: hypothetical protein B7Z33_07320 [Sphingomonadales bacterium 12-68-11]OYX09468.1 MAG: hypothetical protein B7Z08_05210 [Sphingomonadales bacterium 32-68-7]
MRRALALPLAALLLIAAGDPATETEHLVAAGETLGGIANRAGVPLVVIAEANGLTPPYRLRSGQALVIPRQRTHTVAAGETGFAIAYRYGVSWRNIATANGLDPNGTLRAGRRLIIPAVLPDREAPTASAAAAEPYFRRPSEGAVLLGWRRREDGSGHEGIDFAVRTGDAIRAAAAGTVLFAGDEPERFGRLVVIDHGNGWHSAYGHLSRVTVRKGDPVRAGERVGLGGDAGDATRPELHFEIRRGDRPVDPAPLLRLEAGE